MCVFDVVTYEREREREGGGGGGDLCYKKVMESFNVRN